MIITIVLISFSKWMVNMENLELHANSRKKQRVKGLTKFGDAYKLEKNKRKKVKKT